MKSKLFKIIIIILVFGVPIAIAVFLNTQGTNYFELPLFHQEGVIASDSGCPQLKAPYHLDYQSIGLLAPETFPVLFVFFTWKKGDEISNRLNILSRIRRNYGEGELNIQILYEEEKAGSFDAIFRKYELANTWNKIPMPKDDLVQLSRCEFVNIEMMWVMADEQGRIRGYYDMDDEREQERLIVEIKILKEDNND